MPILGAISTHEASGIMIPIVRIHSLIKKFIPVGSAFKHHHRAGRYQFHDLARLYRSGRFLRLQTFYCLTWWAMRSSSEI